MGFHPWETIFLLITTTIIGLIHKPISVFAKNVDEQYLSCNNTGFRCGDLPYLRYPFWGSTQPAHCGHPEFKLRCTTGEAEITMDSLNFRVLDINTDEHTLKLVRTDYWNNVCTQALRNATLNTAFFNYTRDTQDLALFYSCPSSVSSIILDSFPNNLFNCSTQGEGFDNLYLTENQGTIVSGVDSSTCRGSVIVRVSSLDAVRVLETISVSHSLTDEIGSGFGIKWDANNSMCDKCVQSGGLCGSKYPGDSGEFSCYCKDRPYATICGGT